jgi:hypothetical protein
MSKAIGEQNKHPRTIFFTTFQVVCIDVNPYKLTYWQSFSNSAMPKVLRYVSFEWFPVVSFQQDSYRANFAPGKFIDIDNYTISSYLQNTFAIGHGLSLELSGPNVWGGTYITRSFWFTGAGIQHKSEI